MIRSSSGSHSGLTPEVVLSVGLPLWQDGTDAGHADLRRKIQQRLEDGIADVLQGLGIPGHIRAEIVDREDYDADRLYIFRLAGAECLYPFELLERVAAYVEGRPLSPLESPATLADRLRTGSIDPVEFAAVLGIEVLKRRPGRLLGEDQLDAYLAQLELPEQTVDRWAAGRGGCLSALRRVLDLRISIADHAAVADASIRFMDSNRSWQDLAECLIEVLRPKQVTIRLQDDYLREITTLAPAESRGRFQLLRDGLFYEQGSQYPAFRFEGAASMKERTFCLVINDLPTLPRVGLRPEQLVANVSPEEARRGGFAATPTRSPVGPLTWSLLEGPIDESRLPAGHVSWDPLSYVVLSGAGDLRPHAACFIDRGAAASAMRQLGQYFPALIEEVAEQWSTEDVARVLRALVSEGLSIRNLRLVLERMLDFDIVVADSSTYIVIDDRFPVKQRPTEERDEAYVTDFVRMGMKPYISEKYAGSGHFLTAYLLGMEIEQTLDAEGEDPAAARSVQEAVRSTIPVTPSESSSPVLLTSVNVRSRLRRLLADEYPHIPVLSYQELPEYVSIQPVSRIPA